MNDWVDRIMRLGEVAEPDWVVHKLGENGGGLTHMIFCPACKCGHGFDTVRWVFNENYTKPTLSPQPGSTCSVLVRFVKIVNEQPVNITCHFHLTDGVIQYCDDCTHELRGQSVELKPF